VELAITAPVIYTGSPIEGYAGLFAYANSSRAKIKNLKVSGTITITETSAYWLYVGGIVGKCWDSGVTITNCSSSVVFDVTLSSGNTLSVGGITGSNGTITNCWSNGTVRAVNDWTGSGDAYAGGIGGQYGSITNCWSSSAVSASGTGSRRAGGIIGFSSSTINNCVAINPSIQVNTGTAYGRIWQYGSTTTGNYALSTMLLGVPGSLAPVPGGTGTTTDKNGADLASDYADSASAWTSATGSTWTISASPLTAEPADGATPWEWGNGKPKLWWE
jgi:hypothetical protein